MVKAAVLGAGYMGGAITFPLSENGVRINLWGTWLDDEIIDSCARAQHPKLKKKLPESVTLYYSDKLKDAVKDVDMIIIGVASEGFLPVFNRLLDTLEQDPPVFTLTKGFIYSEKGIKRVSEGAEELFRKKFPDRKFLWTSIGGPVKAVELSNRVPSATVFGLNCPEIKQKIRFFSTGYYRVFTSDDVAGVELSSAFKNVYSIALGICDGLYRNRPSELNHNLRAFLFNQSVREMAFLAEMAGGKRETVFDFAGVGDLHVTSSSGRNREFGEYIGMGVKPDNAYENMLKDGEIAEGYSGLKHGIGWVNQLRDNRLKELPLLKMLCSIVCLNHDAGAELERYIEKIGY